MVRHTSGAGVGGRWRWSAWVGYAAAAWSLVYGGLGLFWALGGAGFPFGHGNDPEAALSALAGVRAAPGAPVIAALGLAGAAVALAMVAPWGRLVPRWPLLGFAWGAAAVLLLVVPDYRVLRAVAYAPIFLVGAPFGWPPVSFRGAIPWPVLNQVVCLGGGLSWVAAAVAYRRRTEGACERCGRTDAETGWTTPAAAARWGRWATAVAVVVPCLYAATRWAWALGIPLGISKEFMRKGEEEGLWVAGAALATVAVGGAVLTLGLVQRWGEIFPRWLPGLAGKRVPPALAVLPATVAAVALTGGGLAIWRMIAGGAFGDVDWAADWGAGPPVLLFLPWGVALGLATLAYQERRRGRSAG